MQPRRYYLPLQLTRPSVNSNRDISIGKILREHFFVLFGISEFGRTNFEDNVKQYVSAKQKGYHRAIE